MQTFAPILFLLVCLLGAEAGLFDKGHNDYGYNDHHGGGGYHGYGHYSQKPIVVHKPVLKYKKVLVKQPTVGYKKIIIKPPPPPAPKPLWINKAVITTAKEWRLVDVPRVTYKPVLVQPTPYYGTKKSHKFKFFDKFKH